MAQIAKERVAGSLACLLGQGVLFLTLLFRLVYGVFADFTYSVVDMALSVGLLVFLLLVALAISRSLDAQRKLVIDQRQAVIAQSRFTSFGKMIGMIAHQWRAPLARQGAMLTELQILLEHPEKNHDVVARFRETLLPRMQENHQQLGQIFHDFQQFFASDVRREVFDICKEVDHTIALIATQQIPDIIDIEFLRPEGKVVVNNYPSAFTHVLLTIIENAIDIFAERDVLAPVVVISVMEYESGVLIRIADNGGGIHVTPIEKVFASFFSGKIEQGMGMGLHIAKMLVEDRMGGTLSVENLPTGACFDVYLWGG
ncbi:signal transduction histidine kinase [Desulfurispira natronophila]|uniref:histidine kinase n=2 Tax=Desulfurispira natronophila TaxID=682562 RepID=A0A7W7Y4C7_9BACT|nr:signal transduction histidine kinase [Desulfurispira natronophila]